MFNTPEVPMSHPSNRRGFTLTDLIVVLVIFMLVLLLPGVMKQRWNAGALTQSLDNVRHILAACGQYRLDHAWRVPMRCSRYTNGNGGGWDTWNYAGKNCNEFWYGGLGGSFDESAYGRVLNPYIQSGFIPVPAGYVNVGTGSTWTFNEGTPTAAQRSSFQVKACRSPGDVATRQRSWPVPTPGTSTYNDIGTSYVLNMKWWEQAGPPPLFTLHYNAGTEKISGLARNGIANRAAETFVWISDTTAEVVANSNWTVTGEFGGLNRSVLGFLSGSAAYKTVIPQAMSGPGYTFAIPWP
jgi:type II secretory pathway pseudopilin PulG